MVNCVAANLINHGFRHNLRTSRNSLCAFCSWRTLVGHNLVQMQDKRDKSQQSLTRSRFYFKRRRLL